MMENEESQAIFEQMEHLMKRIENVWPEEETVIQSTERKDIKFCPLKSGFKCSVISAKRVNKGIVNTIKDGRCYVEMCPSVSKLIYNNSRDGFGSKVGYDIDQFSLVNMKRKTMRKTMAQSLKETI